MENSGPGSIVWRRPDLLRGGLVVAALTMTAATFFAGAVVARAEPNVPVRVGLGAVGLLTLGLLVLAVRRAATTVGFEDEHVVERVPLSGAEPRRFPLEGIRAVAIRDPGASSIFSVELCPANGERPVLVHPAFSHEAAWRTAVSLS